MKTTALVLASLLLPAAALGIVGCGDDSAGAPDSGGQDATAGTDAGGSPGDATGGDSTTANDSSGGSDGTGGDAPSGNGDAGPGVDAGVCDMTARPACTSPSANCLLVDDFDKTTDAGVAPVPPVLPPNEAGVTGTWVVSADTVTDSGVTLPNPFSATAGGAGDAGDPYAMWFFASGHPNYADFEVSFQGADGSANAAWNVSAYSGIQFWAKKDAIDGGSTVAPLLSFKTIPAGFTYVTHLTTPALTTNWQLFYVPFCAFVSGASDGGPVDPSQFSGLAFTIGSPSGIWIDQVYLVK